MPKAAVQFGPNSDQGKSVQASTSLLVNCYVEQAQGGKSAYSIYTDPGRALFSTVSAGQIGRGFISLGNNLYAVVGETLYKVQSNGIATSLGVILGTRACVFSINRKAPYNQITITADTKNYYIENDVLTEITDPDLPSGVHSNAYLNGRTIYGLNDGRYFISADNNTSSIAALDFAEAERSADQGIRVFANGEEFWYFGTESLEIFRDSGATFPFEPLLGAGQGKGSGCLAKNSVAIVDGSVFWVSDLKLVVRAQGYSPVPISTHDVERDIEAAVTAGIQSTITGYAYESEGHLFYYLSCSLWFWVYDASTNHWHKKEDYLVTSWSGRYYLYTFNKHLILDATDGCIYEYLRTTNSDKSMPLITKMVSANLNDFPEAVICNSLSVDVQAGVGRASGAAHEQDPQLILRVSRDGGETWGRQYMQSLGQQGKWVKQVRFNRLGAAYGAGLVFELTSPEPVERAVFQAVADVTPIKG